MALNDSRTVGTAMRSVSLKSAIVLTFGIDGVERHGAVRHGPDRFDLVGRAAGPFPQRQQRRQRGGAVVGRAREDGVENRAGPAQRGRGGFDLPEAELVRFLLQDAAADHDVDREIEQSALLDEGHLQRRLRADDGRGRDEADAARHASRRPAAGLRPRSSSSLASSRLPLCQVLGGAPPMAPIRPMIGPVA